jgi:signal transduction histidine kinase
MSIVKQLVARFGGEVQVTSKLGKGTTFTALLKMES